MIDDQRLKTLMHITDAKESVQEILATGKTRHKAKRLKELQDCLERIEGDLSVTALDQSLSELREYQQELFGIDSEIERDQPEMKSVAKKVEHAAREIGAVIELAAKVAPPP